MSTNSVLQSGKEIVKKFGMGEKKEEFLRGNLTRHYWEPCSKLKDYELNASITSQMNPE
jgi:hypothetical protein